ncbi:MAG: MFS transporter [Candidatus Hodarchaeota archaeon]
MTEENKVTYTKKYTYYTLFVMGMMNIIDIFTSNVGPLVASFVVEEFFISRGVPENEAYAQYGFAFAFLPLFFIIGLAFRFIADRYGRRPALIINVVGMTVAGLLLYFSPTFLMYYIGAILGAIFLTADIQVLLMNEECPPEKRSQYVMLVMIMGLAGALLVILMRYLFMSGPNPNWRVLYLLPFIGGIIVSILAIFTLKESSVYLTMKAMREANPEKFPEKESFGKAMKSVYKLDNFRTIFIIIIVGVLGMLGGFNARAYWEPFMSQNFTFNEVNIIYVIRYLISIPYGLMIGRINDKVGRKAGLYTTLIFAPLFLILCLLTLSMGNVIITGIFYGLFIYSIWLTPTTTLTMINELTPTNYRGTVSIFNFLIMYVLIVVFTVIFAILVLFLPFQIIFVIAVVPGCLIAIPIVIKKLPETRATDLTKVG